MVFSSESQAEADFYLEQIRCLRLTGRIEVVQAESLSPFLQITSSTLIYHGEGRELDLPEGLVWLGPEVILSDWRVSRGFPTGVHALNGQLMLKRCHGTLSFPPDFQLYHRFQAELCTGLVGLPAGRISMVSLDRCNLPSLPGQPEVRQLSLVQCRNLASLDSFRDLEKLRVDRCRLLKELPDLPALVYLDIRGGSKPPRFARVPPNLQRISLREMAGLQELRAGFPHSRYLEIEDCPKLHSIGGIREALEGLTIQGCPRLTALPGDLEVRALKLLRSGLSSLPVTLGLQSLQADDCRNLQDLGVDSHALGELEVTRCPRLDVLQYF